MAQLNFRDWSAAEGPKIERALDKAANELPAPCRPIAAHILKAGGKRLRPLLVVAFARLLGYEGAGVYPLAASLEMLHAATLLHDDILDSAASRRGRPAAHTIFGQTRTILTGDALLAAGNAVAASYGDPRLVLLYSRATTLTAAGEILEMDSLGNPRQTHEQYLEIALTKTAALIANACAMGAVLGGAGEEESAAAYAYGENLGLAFQIVDDALDFAPEEQTGKPSGGDLREGKLTPPIRLFAESLSPTERERFDHAFASREFPPEYFAALTVAVRDFSAPALAIAADCVARARLALDALPKGQIVPLLNQIADYVLARCK